MMLRLLIILLFLAGLIYSLPPKAQENPPQTKEISAFKRLVPTANDAVKRFMDERVFITQGGQTITLTNIDSPGLWKETAFKAARDILQDKAVRVYQSRATDKQLNRFGHRIGYSVLVQDQVWIEQELVRAGLARVMPEGTLEEGVADLYRAESEARTAKKGLWADPDWQIRDATRTDILNQDKGRYMVVAGTVRAVAQVKNTIYFNFGDQWRTDFTLVIDPALRRAFARDGVDLFKLTGKNVRARGMIKEQNGPAIILWQKAMLELN